jgi:myo-inositol-hexaphosphate 3-phosphohydrolase
LALLSLCFHASVPVLEVSFLTVKNATNALTKKHPDNSYIAKIDDNGKLTVYDLSGNEVNLNVNGKYR